MHPESLVAPKPRSMCLLVAPGLRSSHTQLCSLQHRVHNVSNFAFAEGNLSFFLSKIPPSQYFFLVWHIKLVFMIVISKYRVM